MHTGTISDLDAEGQYGLIDADDGRFVLFNLSAVAPPLRDTFRIGARVEFVEQDGILSRRALALALALVQPHQSTDPG